MKVLRKVQLFTIIFGLIIAFATNVKAQTSVINFEFVNSPKILFAGQSHIFTFEIQNATDQPLTFSQLPGFHWELNWFKGKDIIGAVAKNTKPNSVYTNPKTGANICRDFLAQSSDFVTLKANERRRFEITVDVPDYLHDKNAITCFNFESACDGKNLGFAGWVGETSVICVGSRIERKKRVN